MPKIIDAQSHYMPPAVAKNTTFFKVNWSDIDRHLVTMDQFGIEQSLLLYPTSDAYLRMGGWTDVCREYNRGIAEILKKYPHRFIGAGILPVDNAEDLTEELKRFEDYGFQVISLASSYDGKYLDDELFFPLYEFAQENALPVHVHSQIINPIGTERLKDPLLSPVLEYVFDISVCLGRMMMNGTFSTFPDIKFIFAHYGGVLPFVKERFDNTYAMLRRRNYVKDLKKSPSEYFKNLYLDTSGSCSPSAIRGALEVVDAAHILWASDYPANQDIAASIAVVEEASWLSDEEKTGIFSENLLILLESISSSAHS